ncbi:MAG: hypothetical protein E5Y31_25305 [Mesorhizobium sp.]|nr:MAG: hypothetical protein E5Y31_25305 [Mesorhizobium sp.]
MRNTFHGYYQPSEEEFEKLWSEGLLVPDNNVLMHLFRFMPKQRQEVLAAFKSFGDRLWLPHQVAKELQDGWRSADSSNRGAYTKLKEDLAKKMGEVEDLVRRFSRFDPWPEGSPMNQISEFFGNLSTEVDTATANLPEVDDVFTAVSNLFDGKVGDQPEQKEFDARVKEAERRVQAKIPPGYMDKRPGDYLIWAEMKVKAKAASLPILFVTDDRKEDWWLEQSGKTIGPRPELRQEFLADAGQMFYAYPPARFLSLLRERSKNLVSKETVQEMERAEFVPFSPQLDGPPWLGQLVELGRETGVEPHEILKIARRIATLSALSAINRAPTAKAPWTQELDDLYAYAARLLSNDGQKTVTSSAWAKFLQLCANLTEEEHLQMTQPREIPKRARY